MPVSPILNELHIKRFPKNGKYDAAIWTQPGTHPDSFNGLKLSDIVSPTGSKVENKFYTDRGSEYIMTTDGLTRRIKTPHSNTGGSDTGLHDWSTGKTFFLDGPSENIAMDVHEIFKTFDVFLFVTTKDGYLTAVTLKNGKMVPISWFKYKYSTKPAVGKSVLEIWTNGKGIPVKAHPGNKVSHIEKITTNRYGGQLKYQHLRK